PYSVSGRGGCKNIVFRNRRWSIEIGKEIASRNLMSLGIEIKLGHELIFVLRNRSPSKGELPVRFVRQRNPVHQIPCNRTDSGRRDLIVGKGVLRERIDQLFGKVREISLPLGGGRNELNNATGRLPNPRSLISAK